MKTKQFYKLLSFKYFLIDYKREKKSIITKENKPFKYLIWAAAKRARNKNLEFNITEDDLEIPSKCPLLGIRIFHNTGKMTNNSPSIDRIDNSKGYTKDNIWIISHKANVIKNSASFEEFEMIYRNWSSIRQTRLNK